MHALLEEGGGAMSKTAMPPLVLEPEVDDIFRVHTKYKGEDWPVCGLCFGEQDFGSGEIWVTANHINGTDWAYFDAEVGGAEGFAILVAKLLNQYFRDNPPTMAVK